MDMMMCEGHGCPKKDKCYRHTAKAEILQSYFTESPLNDRTKECEFYWEAHDESDI